MTSRLTDLDDVDGTLKAVYRVLAASMRYALCHNRDGHATQNVDVSSQAHGRTAGEIEDADALRFPDKQQQSFGTATGKADNLPCRQPRLDMPLAGATTGPANGSLRFALLFETMGIAARIHCLQFARGVRSSALPGIFIFGHLTTFLSSAWTGAERPKMLSGRFGE